MITAGFIGVEEDEELVVSGGSAASIVGIKGEGASSAVSLRITAGFRGIVGLGAKMMQRAKSSNVAVGDRSERSESESSITSRLRSSFWGVEMPLVLNNVAGVEFGGALYEVALELAVTELDGSPTPTTAWVAKRTGLVGVRGDSGTSIMGSVCTPTALFIAVVAGP